MELAADQEGYSSASESIISNAHFVHALAKRKRTNRQRIQPLSIAVTDSSSASFPEEISGIITEEDDMANCLILLAQGRAAAPEPEHKFTNRRFVDSVSSKTTSVYAYECKTCNKCFPSFQALGGHRTSHKKPKFPAESSLVKATDNLLQDNMNSFSAKQKVHECAICGSEFSSGQALGGHMRRHRTLAMVDTANKDYKSFLSLDLNLPAPADVDELQRSSSPPTFTLAGKRPLLFSGSASALVVDCHQ